MTWSLDSLERACRKALPDTSVKLTHLPESKLADIAWEENTKARIRVDGNRIGVLVGVVHELLHYVLDADMQSFDDEVEEEIIVALEKALIERITASKRRLAWWRKAISQKLPKSHKRAMLQTRRKSQDGYSTEGFWRERDTPGGSK